SWGVGLFEGFAQVVERNLAVAVAERAVHPTADEPPRPATVVVAGLAFPLFACSNQLDGPPQIGDGGGAAGRVDERGQGGRRVGELAASEHVRKRGALLAARGRAAGRQRRVGIR